MSKYAIGSKEWRLYSGKGKATTAAANYSFANLNQELKEKGGFSRDLNYSWAGKSSFTKKINPTTVTNNTMPLIIASVLIYLIYA